MGIANLSILRKDIVSSIIKVSLSYSKIQYIEKIKKLYVDY